MKEITATNTSILSVDRLRSVSWCRGNCPGLVPALSAMTALWRRRSRKREPVPATRSRTNRRERKDFTRDRNDLKGWTAGESAHVWGDIVAMKKAAGGVRTNVVKDAPNLTL